MELTSDSQLHELQVDGTKFDVDGVQLFINCAYGAPFPEATSDNLHHLVQVLYLASQYGAERIQLEAQIEIANYILKCHNMDQIVALLDDVLKESGASEYLYIVTACVVALIRWYVFGRFVLQNSSLHRHIKQQLGSYYIRFRV